MNERENRNSFNAVLGQFTTLNGQPYVGPYHLMKTGIPMTGANHTAQSQVLIPIPEGIEKQTTSSLLSKPEPNTELNENTTTYDLIPTIINRPPIIVKSILEASTPQIKQYAAADASGDFMYQFPDGTVKVHKGVSITLRVEAQQPEVLNVENGILVMKPSNAELTYQWYFNGELIGNSVSLPTQEDLGARAIDELGAQRYNPTPNSLSFTQVIPRYAGTYTCTVSNDIGTTDAGSVELEVYNSDIDSFFYSNLIQNGNGEEGTEGWNGLNDGLVAKQINNTLDGSVIKSIVVDPFNPQFTWTKEMMHPPPYTITTGRLKPIDNPAQVILMDNSNDWKVDSFFTRKDYTYTVNNGIEVVRAYQEIELPEVLEPHIRGAIYGVRGLQAVCCAYLGNAIMNYEPNKEFTTPGERSKAEAYYLGASRLSVENFSKAGPGFVTERVYVTIQEYVNNQPIKSRLLTQLPNGQTGLGRGVLVIEDPWSRRLPKYRGEVYYPGGLNYAIPDVKSLGDGRDAHLFVADELMPYYEDRFTYGQYAEFNREIIERLNPKTNKIRVTINIEAPGLSLYLKERNDPNVPKFIDKLWELLPWSTTWPARSFGPKNTDGWPSEDSPFNRTVRDKKGSLEEKLPKIGESRAFVSGLTMALVPYYLNSDITEADAQNILTETGNSFNFVESPIDLSIKPYNAQDTGERYLDVVFNFNNSTAEIHINLNEINPYTQEEFLRRYEPGLFPFSENTSQTGIKTQTISATPKDINNNLVKYIGESQTTTNGILIPLYAQKRSNKIAYGAFESEKYSPTEDGEFVGPVTYKRLDNQATTDYSPNTRLIADEKQDNISITQLRVKSYKYDAKGEIERETWELGGGNTIGPAANQQSNAPLLPYNWYAVPKNDQLSIIRSEQPTLEYTRFATPSSPLILEDWKDLWSNSMFNGAATSNKDQSYNKNQLVSEQALWSGISRFVITLGVYDANLAFVSGSEEAEKALVSYQNYYLDLVEDGAIIHQTPNIGGVSRLYSFNEFERWNNKTTNNTDIITFKNIENIEPPTASNQQDTALSNSSVSFSTNTPSSTFASATQTTSENFESYTNPDYHTFTDDPANTKTAPVQPIFIPSITTENVTATFKLPAEFLIKSQTEGGLALPFDQNGNPDLTNYRVVLYGVRPVTNGEAVEIVFTSIEDVPTFAYSYVNNAKTVTTPFEGEDIEFGHKFTVRQIEVSNTFA